MLGSVTHDSSSVMGYHVCPRCGCKQVSAYILCSTCMVHKDQMLSIRRFASYNAEYLAVYSSAFNLKEAQVFFPTWPWSINKNKKSTYNFDVPKHVQPKQKFGSQILMRLIMEAPDPEPEEEVKSDRSELAGILFS